MKFDNRLDIHMLGRLEISFGGRRLAFPTRHSGFLIGLLALEGRIPRETAAARLWGERGEAQARASLRQTIYHVQKVLTAAGAPELLVDRQSLGLAQDSYRSDLAAVLAAIADSPAKAARAYTGELFGDIGRVDPSFQDWLSLERQNTSDKLLSGFLSAGERLFESADWPALDPVSTLCLKLDPFNEKALAYRMEALARSGKRASALAQFERFRELLASDLGVEPEPKTLELRDRIAALPERATNDDATARENTPAAVFRERRSLSLLAAKHASIIQDPEAFAARSAEIGTLLRKVLRDETAQILEAPGLALVCVFGGHGVVERHAEAAIDTAEALSALTAESLQMAVVSGDIIEPADVTVEPLSTASIGHLLSEAGALLHAATPGEVSISKDAAFRRAARPSGHAFVARRAELASLDDAYSTALRGEAQIVGIVGEAGIGKSTLLRQFLAQHPETQVLLLEGYDREASHSFGAIARFLTAWLSGTQEPSRTVIEEAIVDKGLSTLQREVLLALLGFADSDEARRAVPEDQRWQIFTLARLVIDTATAKGPVILAIEDVHWLDPDSAAFLERLIGEVSSEALLIVTTFRPELQVGWIGRSSFRLLRLVPLNSAEAEKLLSPLLKGMPDKLSDLLLSRAGGNPFLLVETARAMAASGASEIESVPATIRDVVNAQLHRLSPDERRLLQCAAVLGMQSEEARLAALSSFDPPRLDAALARLRQEELLVRRSGQATPRHRFRHALLYDAVYAAIPKLEATALHAKACALLQERADADPANIALHARLSEDWPTAATWSRRAGDHFTMLSSYGPAVEAYRHAIAALAHCPEGEEKQRERLALALKLRPVLVPLGLYEQALIELQAAEALAAEMTDRTDLVAVHISQSYLFSSHGRLREAIDFAQRAGAAAPPEAQANQEAKLAEGQARSLMGDWKGTLALLQPTLAFWDKHRRERFGHTGTRSVWCHGYLSHALCIKEDLEAAAVHAQEAFDIATETQRPFDMIFALHRLGRVQIAAGNHEEALALLMEVLRRSDEIEAPIIAPWCSCDAVQTLLAVGRIDEAHNLLNRHTQAAKHFELRHFHGWLRLRKAELLEITGRHVDAAAEAQAALASAQECGDLLLEPTALALLAQTQTAPEKATTLKVAREMARARALPLLPLYRPWRP